MTRYLRPYVARLMPWLLLCCLWTRGTARAAESGRLEQRLAAAAVNFEALQADPGRAIPPAILREARGLVILRETKAGLILGGKNGSGVALVKWTNGWSAPAFYRVREAGIGLQAGWQSATFVHVLMTEAAVSALRTNDFRFGVGLRITSGPRTVGDEAKTSSLGSDVLVYSDTGGLFGGLAVEGGVLKPDDSANRAYHGRVATEILFPAGPAPGSPPGPISEMLRRYSRAEGDR